MNDSLQIIGELIEATSVLARRAESEYAPIVDAIVRSRSTDIRHIEHTLDGLLDFCFDPVILLLYKRLCRHYFALKPAYAISYVNTYSELWETEVTNSKLCFTTPEMAEANDPEQPQAGA
jgi:hypothetical protein